ncbi:MAG TPA: putative glycoside hydrolase [Solirubrobacteraceae bacterium]|jgi:hypothetical protein
MHKPIARIFLGALLAGALTFSAPLVGAATADTAGTVHFVRQADSSFDQFTSSPTAATEEWMRSHVWRMTVWSPYFDNKTSWYSNGWVYDDSYAIYHGSSQAKEHPEWILRDAAGDPLYIPSGCSGTSCPQYAGDISNAAFRQAWIEELKGEVAHGYRGVFIDDVNMDMQVGNGNEEAVAPIDRSTGQPMTAEAWRSYMARFMQEVRAQLPNLEIAHNAIWYADDHAGTSNAYIRAEIEAANYVFLERGANDSGLTGREGQWSLQALLAYVDEVHALGRDVVMDGTSSKSQGLAYNLASYFLVSNGNDAVSGDDQTPTSWWSGWNVNLGEARGPRYDWNHLLRRDFAGGMVLVNQPGEPTQTVSLPSPMRNSEGETVTSVTLPANSGVILTGNPPIAPGEEATADGGTTRGGSTTDASSGSTSGSDSSRTSTSGNGSSTDSGSWTAATSGPISSAGGPGANARSTGRPHPHNGRQIRHRDRRLAGAKTAGRRARAAHVRRARVATRGHRHGGGYRTRATTH